MRAKLLLRQALAMDADDCLTGSVKYPSVPDNIKSRKSVRRIVAEEIHGPAPSKSYHAGTNCKTPGCVSGRHVVWEHKAYSRNRKLNDEDVLAIRADNRTYREIAAQYGVHPRHIGTIKRREKWAFL